MPRKHLLLTLLALLLSSQNHAYAQDENAYLSLGAGLYDAFRTVGIYDGGNFSEADFRVEYRSNDIGLLLHLKPWLGLEFTSRSSQWFGGGLLYDWRMSDNIIITPNTGVGWYNPGASNLDLDGRLEFRLQIEAAYEFENKHRLGVAISHISNASTADNNPGTEIANIYYHIPVGRLF